MDRKSDAELNKRLPLFLAAPLGLQHMLAIFAGTITVPLIVAEALELSAADRALMIQATLFVSGIGTLLQSRGMGLIGARLPLVLGTSFAYIGIAISTGSRFGLSAIFGAVVVAGLAQVIVGRLINHLRFLFPPLVTGLYVLLIGVTLMPVGFSLAFNSIDGDLGASQDAILAVVVLLTAVCLHQFGKGFIAMISIGVAMLIGFAIAFALDIVDLGAVVQARWLSIPEILPFGISFEFSAVLGFLLLSMTVVTESVGDIVGTTIGGLNRQPTDRELSGGIVADGVGSTVAGFFGSLPLVTYSQNVGLVALTGVVSRHVVSMAALFMIVTSLLPKLAALIGAMPSAVLGGVSILMFGSVAAAGLKILELVELNQRSMLIIGLTLAVGVGLPTQQALLQQLPELLRASAETGLVPAAITAIVLNLVLPGRESTNTQRP